MLAQECNAKKTNLKYLRVLWISFHIYEAFISVSKCNDSHIVGTGVFIFVPIGGSMPPRKELQAHLCSTWQKQSLSLLHRFN